MRSKFNMALVIAVAVIVCIVLCIGGMFISHWYAEVFFPVPDGDTGTNMSMTITMSIMGLRI